jgi:hypothetical protein
MSIHRIRVLKGVRYRWYRTEECGGHLLHLDNVYDPADNFVIVERSMNVHK